MSAARRTRSGFSLLETLVAVLVLAMGLLTHVSTTLSEHGMARSQRVRTGVLQVARDVLERLRADEDWPSLYLRLRYLETMAASGSGPVRLADGRTAWTVDTYFPGYVQANGTPDVHILVETPPPQPPAGEGSPILREDHADARFGLPFDLNGDGVIDGEARDDDHLVLPVVVVVLYTPPGSAPTELRFPAWLRGER